MRTICIGLTWYSGPISVEWLFSYSYGCDEAACHAGVMVFGLQLDARVWNLEKVMKL